MPFFVLPYILRFPYNYSVFAALPIAALLHKLTLSSHFVSRSQLCLTALGAADSALIPVEANTKGVNSLTETMKFIDEQTNLGAFNGSVLGAIPFRDRWVGNTQTVDSRENIAAMIDLFPSLTLFPSIKESEQYKRGIRQGHTLSELGHTELEYPFTKIMEVLNRG